MNELSIPKTNGKPSKNPKNWMFNMREIATELHVSKETIRAAKKAGAPFHRGKTRPKWMRKWMRKHPDNPESGLTGS